MPHEGVNHFLTQKYEGASQNLLLILSRRPQLHGLKRKLHHLDLMGECYQRYSLGEQDCYGAAVIGNLSEPVLLSAI